MSRVPTLATQNNLIRRMMLQQDALYKAQYSATTYKKSQTYSGISKDVYRLLNLKNEKSVLEAQASNNANLYSKMENMAHSLESISNALIEFRSGLRDFSGNDLTTYVNGNMDLDKQTSLDVIQQLAFDTLSEIAYYLNTKMDGTYMFGGGSTYSSPINFEYETLEDFQARYDGDLLTYPSSRTSNLSTYASSKESTGNLTFQKLYTTVDTTNTGVVTITDDNSFTATNSGAFSDLKVGMEVTIESDGINPAITRTVKSISEDGSVIAFTENLPAGTDLTNLTLVQDQNLGTITAGNTGGFIVDNIKGSDATTGNFSFDATKNEMTIPIKGGFSKLSSGSSIVISGTANNDGIYYIKEVSEDGRHVVFADETPLKADEIDINATNVNLGITYAISSTMELSGINNSYDGTYTIVGLNDNGTELIVKTDKFTDTAVTFTPTSETPIATSSYYGGDFSKVSYRIDTTTTIDMTITGENAAFEKAIRALSIIAQGNMVDEEGVDLTRVYDRVNEALDLLDSAIDSTNLEGELTSNITTLQNRISNNLSLVKTAQTSQETAVDLLLTNISTIEDVDPLEASLTFLTAQETLSASYSIIAETKQLSLLNYL